MSSFGLTTWVFLSLKGMALDSCPRTALAQAAALAHCMLGFKLWWTSTPTFHSLQLHHILKLGILCTQVEDVALSSIEEHLPLRGPGHQLVNVALELSPLHLILHHPPNLLSSGGLSWSLLQLYSYHRGGACAQRCGDQGDGSNEKPGLW